MSEIRDMIVSSPFFGLSLTFAAYELALLIRKKIRIALLLPFAVAVVLICMFLLVTHVSYEQYMEGGQYISLLMGPATVILAVPVYQQLARLKENLIPVIGGVLLGAFTSFFSTYLLSLLLRIDGELFLTLTPHSVTTPIAISLSEQIGGVGAVSTLSLIISGLIGSIFAPQLRRLFRLKDPVAAGVATGSASHALGTAKAITMGEVEGAFSGLSIGIAGFVTVLLVPFLLRFFYMA